MVLDRKWFVNFIHFSSLIPMLIKQVKLVPTLKFLLLTKEVMFLVAENAIIFSVKKVEGFVRVVRFFEGWLKVDHYTLMLHMIVFLT